MVLFTKVEKRLCSILLYSNGKVLKYMYTPAKL